MNTNVEPVDLGNAQAPPAPALRLFFVEDSPVILDLLVTTLEEMLAVEVVGTAADEASVVKWLEGPEASRTDVMIVDLFLARGSGLSVLQAAADLDVDCRRVVLTNYATPVIRDRCAHLGASKVFDKSTELEAFVEYLGGIGPSARR